MAAIPITGTGTAGTSTARVVLAGAFNANPAATLRDDTVASSGSPLKLETVTLASGWNALTAPAGATMVSIVPPDSNTVALTLKGVTGDTGIALNPAIGARLIGLHSTVSLGVLAASSVAGVQIIWL